MLVIPRDDMMGNRSISCFTISRASSNQMHACDLVASSSFTLRFATHHATCIYDLVSSIPLDLLQWLASTPLLSLFHKIIIAEESNLVISKSNVELSLDPSQSTVGYA